MSTDERGGNRLLLWSLLGALLLVGGLQPVFTLWATAQVTEDERAAHQVIDAQLGEVRMQLRQAEEELARLNARVTLVEAAPRADRARRLMDEVDTPRERHTWEGIREDGPDRYTVQRSTVDFALENLPLVSREARLVPSYRDGQSQGFKMFAIRPGSLFGQLGLRNGDTVTAINDQRLDDVEQAMAAYQQFSEGDEFSIALIRRGEPLTLQYTIE